MKTLTTYQLTILITNLFTMYTIYRFSNVFFYDHKKNRTMIAVSYTLYFITLSIVCILVDIPMLTLATNIIGLFLTTFNYSASIKERVISVSFMYSFMFAVELAVAAVTGIFHIDIFNKGEYNKSTALVICKIITFLLVLIIENYRKIKWKRPISNPLFVATLFIPVSTIYIALIFVDNTNCSKSIIITLLTVLLGLNAFTFYLYDKLSEKFNEQYIIKITEAERNYYYNQCEVMQKSAKAINKFKHDINTHFSVISDLLSKKDFDDASVYIDQLIGENKKTDTVLSKTGNIVIDSIINYKLSEIDTNSIKISTDIVVPDKTNIEIMDLSTILNNLLDNAIKALNEMAGEKILTIVIKYSRKRMIIRITNTYENDLILENGEFVTTKADKKNHGMGIKNVKDAIEKYNGLLSIKNEDGVFITDVLLYDTPLEKTLI